jgi:hypothetical protein
VGCGVCFCGQTTETASFERIESEQGDTEDSHAFYADPATTNTAIQRRRETSGDTKPNVMTALAILEYSPGTTELFTGQL